MDALVARHGSLAATAELLAAQRNHAENVGSIERALRRLRGAAGDGGVWGARVLATFGLPDAVLARLRWMGCYHSRFTDLPTPVAADLLRHWEVSPVRMSPDAAFLDLGWATLHLRRREPAAAAAALARQHALGARTPPVARVEAALVGSFLHGRTDRPRSLDLLEVAGEALEHLPEGLDRQCQHARWVDQRAYLLNRPETGRADPAAAEALYAGLDDDGPPFVQIRRRNGLGWSVLVQGRRDEAREHARRSVAVAGDAGFLRLRSMALKLLAATLDGPEATRATARAAAIARSLEDELLLARFAHGLRSRERIGQPRFGEPGAEAGNRPE